jgi:hypothetical protein
LVVVCAKLTIANSDLAEVFMSSALSPEEAKRLLRVFRMPVVQSMKSRKTSITNAFVSTIIPVIRPSPEDISEALKILGMTPETIACAYCGDKCNAWDHLRPLVVNRRPTGYISEIANLVPACQPCNSSKTNSHWKEWMLRQTGNTPKNRGIADLDERVGRLERFEVWREPTKVDFREILGDEDFEEYWRELDRVVTELQKSQAMADNLKQKIADARSRWEPRPESSMPSNDGSCK